MLYKPFRADRLMDAVEQALRTTPAPHPEPPAHPETARPSRRDLARLRHASLSLSTARPSRLRSRHGSRTHRLSTDRGIAS